MLKYGGVKLRKWKNAYNLHKCGWILIIFIGLPKLPEKCGGYNEVKIRGLRSRELS